MPSAPPRFLPRLLVRVQRTRGSQVHSPQSFVMGWARAQVTVGECRDAIAAGRTYAALMASDPFRLARFVDAQAPVWEDVLAELAGGRKRTHWMWFAFPQLAALGRSSTAKHYGISGPDEARAYLQHPLLGSRLLACCELLLKTGDVSARAIFGEVDTLKLRSCLTLFDRVAPGTPHFKDCLDRFFGGQRDPLTMDLLGTDA
jgi:uncharacterized protein (DUF1810 family)